MPGGWIAHDAAPIAKWSLWDGNAHMVVTTGPLAVDPIAQRFVGVLVENDGRRAIRVRELLFSLEECPKTLQFDSTITIGPNCAVGIAYPNPGSFYEVQIALPGRRENIRASVYGLGPSFETLAANTLHWEDLTRP